MLKCVIGLVAVWLATACAGNGVWPQDCNTVPDKMFRDQCFAESILDAQREISEAEATEIKQAKDDAAQQAGAETAD